MCLWIFFQDGNGKSKGDIPLRLVTTIEEVPFDALNRPNVFQVIQFISLLAQRYSATVRTRNSN